MKKKLLSIGAALLFGFGALGQSGPVAVYGQLQVKGNKIYGSKDPYKTTPVQVKGISLGWNTFNESSPYFTANHVDAMVDGWGVEVIRVPMTTQQVTGGHGYYPNPTLEKMNDDVIQRAIEKGVYVIIDWHSHFAEKEPEATNAEKYFEYVAAQWGGYDNVIFEIYNEPLGKDVQEWAGQKNPSTTTWTDIKAYANRIIPIIRAAKPIDQGIGCANFQSDTVDNLILVGTRNFSQCLIEATDNLIGNEDIDNIAYVFHFYAEYHTMNKWTPDGTMGQQIQTAMNKNKAVFVSEWGTVRNDGNAPHHEGNSNQWMDTLDLHKISSCAWQWAGKNEASAFFQQVGCNGCTPSSANWSTEQLITKSNMSLSGQYIYDMLQSWATKVPWRPFTLNRYIDTLVVGETTKLKATPNIGKNPIVEWQSSDPNIAEVIDNGTGEVEIKANGIGDTEIWAFVPGDCEYKQTCWVTILPKITFGNRNSSTITYGETIKITPTVNSSNKNLTWQSEPAGIVLVNETTCEITAIGIGTTIITVTTGDDGTAKYTLTVVSKVTLSDEVVTFCEKGSTVTLTASVAPINRPVIWTKNGTSSLITVDSTSGVVTLTTEVSRERTISIYAKDTVDKGQARCDVIITPCTGTDEISKNTHKIYPNPITNGTLTIEFTEKTAQEIQIYDLAGKLLFTTKADFPQTKIDVSHLKEGNYVVKTGNQSTNVTIMKK